MKYLQISQKNVHLLKDLIDTIGDSSKTFRYIAKREPQSAITNH